MIEVGVDVPEASIMVIEHAERFGLAQLHQLRGRVGRGTPRQLLPAAARGWADGHHAPPPGLLRDTEDGFVIADEDFRLRGGGDLLGKRQSGLPGYKLADLDQHDRLLQIAAKDAAVLMEMDPALRTPRGVAVRQLMQVFDRNEAVRTLEAG